MLDVTADRQTAVILRVSLPFNYTPLPVCLDVTAERELAVTLRVSLPFSYVPLPLCLRL